MKLPVLVLNLPADSERFVAIERQVASLPFIDLWRVEGVRGGLIADVACRLLTRNAHSASHKGAMGCFLSHLSAWEIVAKRKEPASLIIEDDVALNNLALLHQTPLPGNLDIAFCNNRTAYPGNPGFTGFRSLSPSIQFVESHGRAVGGDCYLLTPTAAQQLIRFVEEDSLFSHVDLRMLAYSVPLDWAADYPASGIFADEISRFQQGFAKTHRLNGYSFWPTIATHPPTQDQSRRAAEDRNSRARATVAS